MNLNHIVLAFLLAGVLAVGYTTPASADRVIIVDDDDHGGHRGRGHSKHWKKHHRHDRYCEHREVHHYYREDRPHYRPSYRGDSGTGFGFWVTGLK